MWIKYKNTGGYLKKSVSNVNTFPRNKVITSFAFGSLGTSQCTTLPVSEVTVMQCGLHGEAGSDDTSQETTNYRDSFSPL